jgi:acetoin utilization deacetylase AcuC-like enzyme
MKKLKIVYSPHHKKHQPQKELFKDEWVNHPEVPARVENILKSLKVFDSKATEPQRISETEVLETHRKNYVDFLRNVSKTTVGETLSKKFVMDTYTPITANTYDSAIVSASVAKTAAELVLSGEKLVYSLCRPPGHHAGENYMGGYCYFNNAAIAANFLSQYGSVAILDIDFHHGNGTQGIFYRRNDVLFVSLHADPREKFPHTTGYKSEIGAGKGRGYNLNFPLKIGTEEQKYLQILDEALKKINEFSALFLIISAGFDTYRNDPIGGFLLNTQSYKKIGRKISQLNLPTLIVQEGGYNIKDIGLLARSFIRGF